MTARLKGIIAVEGPCWHTGQAAHFRDFEEARTGRMEARLRDVGGERIADMARAGIGRQGCRMARRWDRRCRRTSQ